MKPNTSFTQVSRIVGSWRSCRPLLIVLAICCWGSMVRAQFQSETWTGALSGTITWTNKLAWTPQVVGTNGDALTFGASPAASMIPANNFTNLPIYSIAITTNGYVISGSALQITNGITDSAGSNTISIPLTLGASQTFQNSVGGASNTQTTVSGALDPRTNNLTIGGNGSVFITGLINSTNGGTLTVNNSGGVARLGPTVGSVGNGFGTNIIQITNLFTGNGTYTATTNIYTNTYVVVGVSTNYYPFTNIVSSTNGTIAYTTNTFAKVAYAVTVSGGILQLGSPAASSFPNGGGVGNVLLNGKLDLNGLNATVNGLDGLTSGRVGNYNTVAAATTGIYTMTVGAGNSNGVFAGIIENGSQGTVALTKTGWGTETLDNGNTYSGATIINQGTLKTTITNSGSLGSGSQVLTIFSGAVFDVSAWNPFGGYQPVGPINVAAGTPTKPYTNFLGSYDPYYPNYVVTLSGTNNVFTFGTNTDLATFTNVVVTTNFVALTYSTNSIISVINADVNGSFNVYGGGQISPSTSISPGIATWTINGNLGIDTSLGLGAPNNVNRANFVLSTNTTPGGGTNDFIYVTGTLNIGDELDVVVTPLYSSLAGGTYTLFHADGGYTATGPVDGNPATFVLFAARGISGSFSSDANNIYLQASGTAAPASNVMWSATSTANNNWDVHLTQNWKTNGASTYFFAQDNVVFDDTGFGTVNLPTVVNASSITFNNNATNYSFNASAINFMTGPGGLTKNGTGQATLANPNSFSGDTTVNGGTLALAGIPGIGVYHNLYNGVSAGNLVLGGGTITQIGSANQSPDSDFNNLAINPGASAITHQNARQSNETPVWVVSNNVTRVAGGVLSIGVANRVGSTCGIFFQSTNSPDGTNDYGSNGILGGWALVNGNNDWVTAFRQSINNQGAIAYANYQRDNNPANWGSTSNVLVGSAGGSTTINVTGTTTINTLKFTNAAQVNLNISGGQALNIASGGILVPTASGVFLNTINGGTLNGASGADLILLNNNTSVGASLTIGSVIADNGGSALTTGGGGTTILTGNNTYTGPTYINSGFSGAPSGTLQVGANGTSGSIASSSSIVDNGTLAFNRSDNISFSGAINGLGSLTKLSAGALTLTANNSLSGQVIISAGTLQLGNGGAAGSVSNAASIVDNGTLVFNNNNTVSYRNPISGYGSLVQFGSGNLIIATNETYSGNTIISNGTMTLTATGYLTNTASISVKGGALLDVSALAGGGLTLRSAAPAETLSGSGTINGSITTAAGTTLSPGSSIGTLTINNGLTLSGGNFNFEVGNASSDLINAATLTESSGTVVITVTGGALVNGVYKLIHTTGGITGSASSLALFGFNQPGQIGVLTNEASGDLSLLVYSGTITSLSWAGSAYGGADNNWNLSSLNWSNAPGALVAFANPAYALFDEVISYTNPVDIQVAVSPTTVTVNATNFDFTLGNGASANKITGGASLVKNGSGQLTLQTTNDYLGGTIINAGTVQLGNNTSQAADGMVGGSGAITLNGTLVASNFATETISGPISGSGQLVQKGVGRLVLAGNNSGFSGGIWATNFLQMGVGGTSGTLGTGPVTNNRTLLFNVGPTPVSTVVVNANITGIGGVTNIGPGIVQLSGNNTYSNSTVIPAGTIQLGSATALPVTTSVVLDDNNSPGTVGTLDMNGYSATIASLQGTATGNGNATLIESTIVNNGAGTVTLTIGGTNGVTGGASTIFNGQVLDNNNGGSGKLALNIINESVLTLNAPYNNLGTSPFPNLFSGGTTISNATFNIGSNNGATTGGQVGSSSAGTGTITLLGGLGAMTNTFGLGAITNNPASCGQLVALGAGGSQTPTLNTVVGTVNVPAGQFGAIYGPARGAFTGTLTGSGTLTYHTVFIRGQANLHDGGFSGTLIFEGLNMGSGGGAALTLLDGAGFPNARVYMHTNNLATMTIAGTVGGNVLPWGSLEGGDNTSQLAGGTNPGSLGSANTIYAIGGLNLTMTNGSQFIDGGCGIRKVGTGTLVLTNNVLSFGGQCVVSNGTLALSPLGNNPGAFNPLTNNYLVGTNFTIVSPGILNVTGMGGTLYLGHNANNQTLFGNGTLNGNLQTMSFTNNLIAPAWGASSRGTIPGNLNVTGNIAINTNCTLQMAVNRTNSPVYDSLTAGGTLTITSARLTVINGGDTAYPAGSSNVFRFFSGSVPVNLGGLGGGITNITVFTNLPAGVFWVTNLTLDGSMAIVNTNSATAPFTNVPGITNFSLAGLNVQLNGTNGQSGSPYYLRTSTNAAMTFTNWTTVATNTFATAGGFTFIGTNVVDTNAPQQFYILSNTNK